jgi:hypothetical protein
MTTPSSQMVFCKEVESRLTTLLLKCVFPGDYDYNYHSRLMRDLKKYYSLLILYGDYTFMSLTYKKAEEFKHFVIYQVHDDGDMTVYYRWYREDLHHIMSIFKYCNKIIKLYNAYYLEMIAILDKYFKRLPSEVILDNILCYLIVRPKEFKYIR